MISIYSPKQQPFGLLSNNARLPINVAGGDKVWKTVTQYVYENLFLKGSYLEKFKTLALDGVYANPYMHFIATYVEMQTKLMELYVVKGTELKLKANESLSVELSKLTSKYIVTFEDDSVSLRSLSDALNLYPKSQREYFFDLNHGAVPRKEVIGVINGIVEALSSGKTVDFTSNFDVIKSKYRNDDMKLGKEFYETVLFELRNKLYMIISVVKRVYAADISLNTTFVDKLLDVYLRKIIADQYPRVEEEFVAKAIDQQMKLESADNLRNIKKRLVSMYNKGDVEIFADIPNPNADLKLEADRSIFMDRREPFIREKKKEIKRLNLTKSKFLPHNTDFPFKATNDVTYPSVLHYVYANFYRDIFGLVNQVDLATTPLNVQETFKSFESTVIHDKIKSNFVEAFDAKLGKYPSVKKLMVHASRQLKWDDENDPVLKTYFTEYVDSVPKSDDDDEYFALTDNINIEIYKYAVFRQWLYLKSEEYFIVSNMFKTLPSTKDLQTIYYFVNANYDVKLRDISLLNAAGIDSELTDVVMPLIVGEFVDVYLRDDNLSHGVKTYVENYSSDSYCFDKTTYNKAVKKLSSIYDDLNDKLIKDKSTFTRIMLSGTLDSESFLPQRVKLWTTN